MKKLSIFITTFLTIILVFSTVPHANASPDMIYSDSEDGIVGSNNFVNNIVINIGDTDSNVYFRGFVKFSLSGISGSISSATLNLYLRDSYYNDAFDPISPLSNPGLGELQVIHIADYGTLSADDFNDVSIGNDPGVLISGSASPDVGYLSIDITSAMQDDIDNGRPFAAFLIKLAINTDSNSDADNWEFRASENAGTDEDPFIEYELAPANPVGGIYAPNDKLNILSPYIALVGIIGMLSIISAMKRRRI